MSANLFVNQSNKMMRIFKNLGDAKNRKLFFDAVRQMSTEVQPKERKSKGYEPSLSFVKNIYLGHLEPTQVFPYPEPLSKEQLELVSMLIDPFEKFFGEVNNPEVNDAQEKVEPQTLEGLWDMGAFAIQVPQDLGGLGLNNTQYARMVEIVGKNDLAVSICLGAHQSIGFKGILLFGTPEQKAKYLPRVSTGKEFAAFCLTEPSAGSDAASVKTRAVLSEDGSHWILNGSKIWISNGGFAEIMTVFAQTTVKDKDGQSKDAITAFIVERSFGGVTSGPPEKKMGIKASNTTEVYFDNVKIPNENVLGGVGNGFKVAMNILNNGRFGMAACLSGTMKAATAKAVDFATQRLQFGRKIDSFLGVQEKLGRMATLQYVTESLAFMISGNMDEGRTDYQLEAALSKCFASEAAWAVTDEAIQIMGGMGFMRQSGLERILRDLRIFRIFEGTNDILRLFVALNGIQHLQKYLMDLQKNKNIGSIFGELRKRSSRVMGLGLGLSLNSLVHPNLSNEANLLCKCIEAFAGSAESLMLKYRKGVIDQQMYLNRLAQATMDIYTMAVVLSRCSLTLKKGLPSSTYEENLTKIWCHDASMRVNSNLSVISDSNFETTFSRLSEVAKMVCSNGGIVQYCLSSHPNKPCYVLKWREITMMLDCGLSAQSVLNFLPLPLVHSSRLSSLPSWMPRDCLDPQLEGELKDCCGRILIDSPPEFSPPQTKILNFSEIDVILISNYLCMLALPFITEDTGFSGVVYCTEPTMQIGRLFLEELVEWIEQSPKSNIARHWKEVLHLLPPPLSDAYKPRNWRHIYNMQQVTSALSRIQVVGYDEKLDIYGALKAIPVSSGYCLGSANWIIQSDYEKIAYVSGSTTLTTHPKPMHQNALRNVNVLIITALTQTPTSNPDSMLGELCVSTAMTVRNGGCVLLPCYPSGVVYDLFECLSSYLDATCLSQIPMFFISPVADTSLAYSNILAEWLSQSKQSKVYQPEEPFPHAFLVKNSRLKHFKNIYAENFSAEFRQPCIVFCGHPSLRFGDSVHFMELWGSNPIHTVIFTEPDFPYLDALSPFQPLHMKVVHCPIDTSLNFTQATKLIRELKPGTLVVPESYTRNPPDLQKATAQKTDLVIDIQERPTLTMKRGEVLKLPVKRKRVKAEMSADLASELIPCETRPGVSLTSVTGRLILNDNKYKIESLEETRNKNENGMSSGSSSNNKKRTTEDPLPKRKPSYEWGWLDIDQFVQKLSQEGINDAKVEHGNTGYIIHLQESDTLITVEDSQTHIICEGDRQLRLKLRDTLLQCLNKF